MTTVVGTIISCKGGDPVKSKVGIRSLSAPLVVAGQVASVTRAIIDTNESGVFSVTLIPGDYEAEWVNDGVPNKIPFAVSGTEGTLDITTLITASLAYVRTVIPQYVLKYDPDQTDRHNAQGDFQIWNEATQRYHSVYCIGTGATGDLVRLIVDQVGEV
jgi:hypothetical protein